MAYQEIYRLQWTSFEGVDMIVHISDTTSGTTVTPNYHDLPLGEGSPLVIKIVDADDNKFTPIRAKQAIIRFLADTNYSMQTFMFGETNRWKVEVYVDSIANDPIFSGYLVTKDLREPFLAPTVYTVELTASDNLGLLKNIPLVKDDGTNPRGYFRIIDFVSWALRKTNLELDIVSVVNLFEENYSGSANATFASNYLWSKTFEAAINESEDCYAVLEKILFAFQCFLVQRNSEWWIIRVDEMNATYRRYSFTYDGTIFDISEIDLSKEIGRIEDIKLIEKDCNVSADDFHKYVKLKYPFQYPIEIPDNIDFERGTTWLSPISVDMSLYIRSYANLGSFPAAGEYDLTYKANDTGNYYKWNGTTYVLLTASEIPSGLGYVFEDWTLKKGNPDSPSVAPCNAYVAKITQYATEKARYVVLTNPTIASVSRSYVESNAIPVGRQDKFTCSVDFRFPTNITNGGAPQYVIMAIRLQGEDGSRWWLGRQVVNGSTTGEKWYPTNSTWTNNSFNPGPFMGLQFNGTIDTTQWQTCSFDAPPVPVNGEVYIQLCAMNSQSNSLSTWDDVDIHYTNLQFNYIPFINGSYQKYNAQYHKVSVTQNYKEVIDETVGISDSPKRLFKGALFKLQGSSYVPTGNWYNHLSGMTGELGLAPFGKYQVFSMWNQYRRPMRIFEGSLLGIDLSTENDLPDLVHRYVINAPSDHSAYKYFMLLSYEMDFKTCKWRGLFAEVYDTINGKIYVDAHEFKYITNNE